MKVLWLNVVLCCMLTSLAAGRSYGFGERSAQVMRWQRVRAPQAQAQARVFPGAVAVKKLVLLKFKKIVPISLILLRSSNENEAELVPVYPTQEIPDDVKFIPTPNGISGHEDVQAIAIPSELHDRLQLEGLADVEKLEALLEKPVAAATNAQPAAVPTDEDEQLLEVAEDADDAPLQPAAKPQTVRRLSNINLKSVAPRTTLEDVPLVIYANHSNKQRYRHSHRPAGTSRNFQ